MLYSGKTTLLRNFLGCEASNPNFLSIIEKGKGKSLKKDGAHAGIGFSYINL